MARQSRYWCFTINNPTEADSEPFTEEKREETFTYYVIGNEIGTEGTYHKQGFCVFKKPLRLTAVKKIIPRAHLEPMRGTAQQASDYCKKDKDFVEYGALPAAPHTAGGQATKQKYETALANAKNGIILIY